MLKVLGLPQLFSVLSLMVLPLLSFAEHDTHFEHNVAPTCRDLTDPGEAAKANERMIAEKILRIEQRYAKRENFKFADLADFFKEDLTSLKGLFREYQFAIGCKETGARTGGGGTVEGGHGKPIIFTSAPSIPVYGGISPAGDQDAALNSWKQRCASRKAALKNLYRELDNGVIFKDFLCSQSKDSLGQPVPDSYITQDGAIAGAVSKGIVILEISNPSFDRLSPPRIIADSTIISKATSDVEGWAEFEENCFNQLMRNVLNETRNSREKANAFIYRACDLLKSDNKFGFSVNVIETNKPK